MFSLKTIGKAAALCEVADALKLTAAAGCGTAERRQKKARVEQLLNENRLLYISCGDAAKHLAGFLDWQTDGTFTRRDQEIKFVSTTVIGKDKPYYQQATVGAKVGILIDYEKADPHFGGPGDFMTENMRNVRYTPDMVNIDGIGQIQYKARPTWDARTAAQLFVGSVMRMGGNDSMKPEAVDKRCTFCADLAGAAPFVCRSQSMKDAAFNAAKDYMTGIARFADVLPKWTADKIAVRDNKEDLLDAVIKSTDKWCRDHEANECCKAFRASGNPANGYTMGTHANAHYCRSAFSNEVVATITPDCVLGFVSLNGEDVATLDNHQGLKTIFGVEGPLSNKFPVYNQRNSGPSSLIAFPTWPAARGGRDASAAPLPPLRRPM